MLSEVDLLNKDIRDGKEGLVRLSNAISSTDLEIVEAQGRARIVADELESLKNLISDQESTLRASSESSEEISEAIAKIESEITIASELEALAGGTSARDFQGDGNRQYVTGLKLGGRNIAIVMDVSASMLDKSPGIVRRFKVAPENVRRLAPKWQQAIQTLEWVISQLPQSARYRLILVAEGASTISDYSGENWTKLTDKDQLERDIGKVKSLTPNGGTSFYQAFSMLAEWESPPDNIFLITDGLPTRGEKPTKKTRVSSLDRKRYFQRAKRSLPRGVPVNVILMPMRGDPDAASEFWKLSIESGGTLIAPAEDWP